MRKSNSIYQIQDLLLRALKTKNVPKFYHTLKKIFKKGFHIKLLSFHQPTVLLLLCFFIYFL